MQEKARAKIPPPPVRGRGAGGVGVPKQLCDPQMESAVSAAAPYSTLFSDSTISILRSFGRIAMHTSSEKNIVSTPA